jgi:hypothetical protein
MRIYGMLPRGMLMLQESLLIAFQQGCVFFVFKPNLMPL